ncbi:LysM peptidoglycan-binding domain-containing protein [Brevibacillus reuszeri]|uniref:LysM peptidoglycan-binding domain-containing protein n=1 Tax=Brevibacillus reuszeri TaxID=54915 RepID=UPI00289CFDD0|nr:LysM peptidoglycan-binding domain-containing protein [Brevibacillus reuszeri]
MNLEPNQLPPRSSRHTQRKVNVSFTKWIRSGLVVFGAVFIGVILIELYQAQLTHESEKPGAPSSPMVTVSETTTDNIASASQEENVTSKAEVANSAAPIVQETKTVPETKVVEKTEVPQNSTTVQPASQPSATTEPKTAPTASPPAKPAYTATTVPASTPAPKPKAIKHVVQKGETLYMLSRKYYGNNLNVSRIAKYNGFQADTQLTAGKVVMVPIAP